MKMPPQLFQDITESINIISRDEPRNADRRSPRVRLSSHLAVATWSDPKTPIQMRIRDLSDGGIGIFHNQRIGLDEQLIIRFPRGNDQTLTVLGTVVYWEPLAAGLYGIGVQFDRIISEQQIADQSDQAVLEQSRQIGVMTRMTHALARTWRIAS